MQSGRCCCCCCIGIEPEWLLTLKVLKVGRARVKLIRLIRLMETKTLNALLLMIMALAR
jgi:hypothetical protein